LLEDLLGLVGGGEVLFGGREVGKGGGVEDEAVAREEIVGGFEERGCGGAEGWIGCGKRTDFKAVFGDVPEGARFAGGVGEEIFVGTEKKIGEGKGSVEGLLERGEGMGVVDGDFDHAAKGRGVEEGGGCGVERFGEKEAIAVVGEMEEIEIGAESVLGGDPNFKLGPGGGIFGEKLGAGVVNGLEKFFRGLFLGLGLREILGNVGDEFYDVFVAVRGGGLKGFFDDGAEGAGEEGEMDDAMAETAEEKFVGDDAKGIDVGGKSDVKWIFSLLGTHVDGGSHQFFSLGNSLLVEIAVKLGDAKVDHFDVAVFGDEDVFRFEVAVDDAVGVEVAEGVGDLKDNFKGFSLSERFLLDELPKRDAADKFHGDVEPFFPLPLPVEADDVGMIGRFNDLSLFEEAIDDLFVLEKFGEEHFDGDGLLGLGMGAEKEDAHAAAIEDTLNFVGANFRGDGKFAGLGLLIG
jgi:hypothetical protein